MNKELVNQTEIINNQGYSFGFAERIRHSADFVIKHWARGVLSGGLAASAFIFPVNDSKGVDAGTLPTLPVGVTLLEGSGSEDVTSILLMDWNGASFQLIMDVSKGLKAIDPFSRFRYNIYYKHPEENLNCNQLAFCDWAAINREVDKLTKSGTPIDFAMVVIRNPEFFGHGRAVVPSCSEPPTNQYPAAVVAPENLPEELKISITGTVAHERGHQHCLVHEGGDIMERKTDKFNAEHTQYLIADNQLLPFSMRRTSLGIRPMLNVLQQVDGQTILDKMELPISAEIPGGTKWVKFLLEQEDGEAVTMIYGSKDIFEKFRKGQFRIENLSKYILQPDQKVRVRIWISNEDQEPAWNSPAWENHKVRPALTVPASPAERAYRTPKVDSTTISPVNLTNGQQTTDSTPTVQWRDSNPYTFYYEVQLSGDPDFEMNPEKAKSFVFWNLVHGGVTNPANSWTVPDNVALPPGKYFWRARPRVQGSGTPVAWSGVYSFDIIPASTAQTLREMYDLSVDNHVINPPKVTLKLGSVKVYLNPHKEAVLNRAQRRKLARQTSKAA